MKHVRQLLLAVFLSLSAIGLARASQSIPPELEIYRLNICALPCWIGITPGKTTIGEAKTLLKLAYPIEEFEHYSFYSSYRGADLHQVTRPRDALTLSVSFNETQPPEKQTNTTIVEQITILTNTPIASIHWFSVLGEPKAQSVTWGNHVVYPNLLYFRERLRLTLSRVFDHDRFRPDERTKQITKLDFYAESPIFIANPIYNMPWQGWHVAGDQLLVLMEPG